MWGQVGLVEGTTQAKNWRRARGWPGLGADGRLRASGRREAEQGSGGQLWGNDKGDQKYRECRGEVRYDIRFAFFEFSLENKLKGDRELRSHGL